MEFKLALCEGEVLVGFFTSFKPSFSLMVCVDTAADVPYTHHGRLLLALNAQ